MKIQSRIIAGYLAIGAIFALMNYGDLLLVREARRDVARLMAETVPAHAAIQAVHSAGQMVISSLQEFLFLNQKGGVPTDDDSVRQHIENEIDEYREARDRLFVHLGRYSDLVTRFFPGEQNELETLRAKAASLCVLGDEFVRLYRSSGQLGDVIFQEGRLEETERDFVRTLERISALEELEIADRSRLADRTIGNFQKLVVVSFFLIFAAAAGTGIVVARKIARPILLLEQASRKITKGEAVGKVAISSTDEVGQLAAAFNIMVEESHAARKNLESLVDERTSLLAETNEALREEIRRHEKVAREKRKLEDRLVQSQKMEAIGTLAGGIAHDFNNILSAILGFTELSLVSAAPGSRLESNLLGVKNSVDRASQLTNQILAFSRRAKNELTPVRIPPVIKEVMGMLRASIPATIDIRQEIDDRCSTAMIMADTGQLHQVLMNLCVNAYHAMRQQGSGTLVVAAAVAEIAEDDEAAVECQMKPGSYLRIEVSDTGHGINPQILPRIFDPYFTTKEQGEGTGLGLAVVHGIVQSLDGHIRVRSEVGRGTAFQIFFPVVEAEAKEDGGRGEELPQGNERLLFVDDEEFIVQSYAMALQGLGYKVTAVTSSIKALHLFRKEPEGFDLVVTDMTMPEMTGEELARDLLAIRPGIPIIICTGFSETMNEEKAKKMGIRDFIMKPMQLARLASSLRKALDRQPQSQA